MYFVNHMDSYRHTNTSGTFIVTHMKFRNLWYQKLKLQKNQNDIDQIHSIYKR